MAKRMVMALAGNPNVGKSTIFNALTAARQHVGNWPGKTVEQKKGYFTRDGEEIEVVDLPGTYSLTAYSIEETVARDFIIKGGPDVVIDIIDAANIERNLYLTLQILELTDRVVIALNKQDIAKSQGVEIDEKKLSELLGVPVIPMIASHRAGLDELIETALSVAKGERKNSPLQVRYDRAVEARIREIEEKLKGLPLEGYPLRWLAVKLLEMDSAVVELVKNAGGKDILMDISGMEPLEGEHDVETVVPATLYEIIGGIVEKCVTYRDRGETTTDRLDRILTHKYLGLPILFLVYGLIFAVTFTLSTPLMGLIDSGFNILGDSTSSFLADMGAPSWLNGLIVKGIIAGVGGVMVFLPVILLFFFMFAIVENSGYMARAAFVMDRIMHKMGLHGKTFLPLLLGYGCNVPAIMATRTLENRKDRLIAILINPLIPCGARLGVMTFIVSIFFTGLMATLVMLSLIMISLGLVFLMGVIFRRFVLPGEHPPFLMELPPYQIPGIKDIALHTGERAWIFVKKAGTVIVAVSILIWIISNYPGEGIENSYAAMLGRSLEPLGAFMGFDWRIMVALIAGFGAKETTITTLGVLYASGGADGAGFITTITASLTPLTAYTFLLVQMIYVPCLATVAMIRKETGSWKWTGIAVGYTLLLAFILGTAVYGLGKLLGWG